ncbi:MULTISPECIES: DNA replication terminus site-binding protein [Pseudoalteromonas]|uniref:DNA replication terminus site-binding protein n=1 Tax=Pseudoalteromonas obscura TaxID=3048491 RepID=A0ABT7ETJ2_9GAMM|nr:MULTISPECIES: DNA replication terminus site-binding protein [Pseudoalteromonas]MBQ4839734.1 hypothetical protein [Pseudoalteromonas luteoviolacea]MDK2598372.1 DNA replication terminus site-binding protein [Pseudoalteromonas sp. P94(2023)]
MQKVAVIRKIRADLHYLQVHIGEALTLLKDAQLQPCSAVYELPRLTQENIAEHAPTILPNPLFNEQARQRFLHHALDFTLKGNHPGVMARRLPGCLCFSTPHDQELRERVAHVNQLKSEFDTFIQHHAGKNPDQRFELVSQAVPLLIRKAVSRNLLLAPQDTFSLSYSWSHSTSRSAIQPRQYWHEKLDRTLQSKLSDVNASNWVKMIEQEKKALANANDSEYFRTIRPLRITPIVNLKYNRGQNGEFNKTTMIAHSPVIVLNDRPKLSPLKPYTGKRIRDARAGPVIARLHLYRA